MVECLRRIDEVMEKQNYAEETKEKERRHETRGDKQIQGNIKRKGNEMEVLPK